MRYLTDSVKFAVRNWRLMIPLFAVLTISLHPGSDHSRIICACRTGKS